MGRFGTKPGFNVLLHASCHLTETRTIPLLPREALWSAATRCRFSQGDILPKAPENLVIGQKRKIGTAIPVSPNCGDMT